MDRSRSTASSSRPRPTSWAAALVGFLAGLVVGAPLTGATVGAMVGGAGTVAVLASVGIGDDFVREVKA